MTDAHFTGLAAALIDSLRPISRRVLAERTLSPGKFGILHHLDDHGPATTAELAAATRVSAQGISLGAKELLDAGLVVKVPDTTDRRKVWLELTEQGRARLAEEKRAGSGWMAQAIRANLTPEEQQALAGLVDLLRRVGQDPA